VAAGVGGALIGTGPGHWLAIGEGGRQGALISELAAGLAGLASVVDQSHAKAVLRVSGPRVRDALAKGCMLDLDPRTFRPGDAATTEIALIGCLLWQVDEAPTFDLAVGRSYAESFWRWLASSAAEFGTEVRAD
jgi:sarcosine oxidase subunit gamma